MTKPAVKIRKAKKTPAEEARSRLAPQPPPAPQVSAVAPIPQPVAVYPKTTIELIHERLAAIEDRHNDLIKHVIVLMGHVGELADAVLYSSGVLHAPPKIAEAARRIAKHHEDKIRR